LGSDNDPDGLAECDLVDLGRGFLHVVAKVLAQLRRLVHRVDAFRIDLVKVPRFGSKGDTEPPRVGPDLRSIRTLGRRRPVWISES
jgi:hypothetical protein